MIDAIVAMLLQATAQDAGQASQTTAPAAVEKVEKKEAPKLICRREFELGSRVKQIRVCRAVGEPEEQQDQTTLQRALDRQGDVAPPTVGVGN
jgi:hypothetical protein